MSAFLLAGCPRQTVDGNPTEETTGRETDTGVVSRPAEAELVELRSLFEMCHGAAVGSDGTVLVSDSYGELGSGSRVYRLAPPYDGEHHSQTVTC